MFAMFFGAEATLGAAYNNAVDGLRGDVIADPYGGALCLIAYGIFYAYPLYKSDNLTLSDFYVERYGPKFGVFTAFIKYFPKPHPPIPELRFSRACSLNLPKT